MPPQNAVFIRIEAPGANTKFWGMPLLKKMVDQYIIGALHEEDIDYEPR